MAIAGLYKNEYSSNKSFDDFLEGTKDDLLHMPDDLLDQWHDEFLGIVRVHHGVVNAEKQPIFNENHTLSIWMDREIFDYQSQKSN